MNWAYNLIKKSLPIQSKSVALIIKMSYSNRTPASPTGLTLRISAYVCWLTLFQFYNHSLTKTSFNLSIFWQFLRLTNKIFMKTRIQMYYYSLINVIQKNWKSEIQLQEILLCEVKIVLLPNWKRRKKFPKYFINIIQIIWVYNQSKRKNNRI